MLLILGTAATWYLASDRPTTSSVTDGGPEMSSKRIQWELERLRDPATGRIPEGIRNRELQFAATHPLRTEFNGLFKRAGIGEYSWTNRGPWNVGGRTRAVAVDVTGDDTILAGGVSGGMWRSSDGGNSWTKTTGPDQSVSVTTIVQDTRPGRSHVWYFGSGELYGNSASGGGAFLHGDGIFKSTDNGRSWFSLGATSSGTPHQFDVRDNIWRLATDPSNLSEDIVYAAIYGRLIRSSDGGESWTEVLQPGFQRSSSLFTDVAVTSSGVVYATFSSEGGIRGIYRSEDGINFANITTPTIPVPFNRIVIGLAPSNDNVVYFLAETPGSGFLGKNFRGDSSWHSFWKYTYVSGSGVGSGGTWENRSQNLPSFRTETAGNGDLYSQGGYDLHVKVKPDDEDVVFIGGTNLYRSTDGFATTDNSAWIGGFRNWKRDSGVVEAYSYPNHHADQHDVTFSPTDPNIMFSASDGGVHKTFTCLADSMNWVSLNSGYLTTQFYTVAVDHGTPGSPTVVGGLQDNGTWRTSSDDPTVPWTRTGSSDGAYCAIADGGRYMYVSKQEGRIYRVELNEEGDTTGSTRIDPAGAKGYRFINPFVLDPNDSRVMYLPIDQMMWIGTDVTAIPLHSNDPAESGWDSLAGSRIDEGSISVVAATTANPANRLWYGTNMGRVYRLDDALGSNPIAQEVTGANMPSGGFVSGITTDPQNGDRAIVAYSNYTVVSLFETTDAGETWRSVSGNLEENPDGTGAGPSVRWISMLRRDGGVLYLAGTSTGLYSTTTLAGDQTLWLKEASESIGNAVVDMIDVRHADGFVAIGTHGSGIWTTTIGALGVKEEERSGAGLELAQNVPNPMGERTTIRYTVPGESPLPVEIILYDTEGREISVLQPETVMGPGEHMLTIDRRLSSGERLPGGMYFYRLRVGASMTARGMQVR